MKKRLHDIFSTSRNERVGLIIIAVIVALFIGHTAFAPTKSELPATTQQLANEFQAAVDSSQVDTVKKKRKKRKKVIDRMAAMTILQSYLDSGENRKGV